MNYFSELSRLVGSGGMNVINADVTELLIIWNIDKLKTTKQTEQLQPRTGR